MSEGDKREKPDTRTWEHPLSSARAGISQLKSLSLHWHDAAQHHPYSWLVFLGGYFVLFLGNANMDWGFFWVWEGKGQPEQISQPELKAERGDKPTPASDGAN